MVSRDNHNNSAAVPQPIPASSTASSQKNAGGAMGRRNSFGAWSSNIFGMPSGAAGTSTSAAPLGAYSLSNAHTFSGNASNRSEAENASSAFSGIGLFRRFSTSQVSSAASSNMQQQQQQATATTASVSNKPGLGHALSSSFHKENKPLQPKVLDEVRNSSNDDPPSRPDSRMRNLMLSGQFLI